MTSTAVLLPETVEQTGSDNSNQGIHWVCVQIEEHPFVGLCGELTNGRRTTATHICKQCMALAAGHGTTCPGCAEWVARLL